MLLALITPSIAGLEPLASDAFQDVVFGAYVVGGLPMALTGWLIARAQRRGARLPSLTLQGALFGLTIAGLSAWTWILAGTDVGNAAGVVAMVAVAGSIGSFVSTLIVSAATGLFARVRAAR